MDTDGDGVLDGDEDFDGDGLTNLQEQAAGVWNALSMGIAHIRFGLIYWSK